MKVYRLNKLKKYKWRQALIVLSILVIFIGGAAALVVRKVYNDNLKPVAMVSQKGVSFTVAKGANLDEIANNLKNKGIIRAAWAFKQYVRSKELSDLVKAGTYRLSPSQSVASIVDDLVEGRVAVNLFTIYPAQRLDQVRAALIEKGGFSPGRVDAALNPKKYAGHAALVDKPAKANLEGYLYPDSYQQIAETTPEVIINAALNEMAGALTPEIRAGIAKQGLSVYEGIILASIVEGEVSDENPADRPKVAQVFLKRLKEGMALESNATTLYGPALEGKLNGLTRQQILDRFSSYESAYNTYNHKGLTPTPVSNISKSSLQAVARPAKTDYVYFVSGDDCVTRFSKTFEQHQQNVATYLKTGC